MMERIEARRMRQRAQSDRPVCGRFEL